MKNYPQVKRWDLLRNGKLRIVDSKRLSYDLEKSWITLWFCLDGKRTEQQLAEATGLSLKEVKARLGILKKEKLIK